MSENQKPETTGTIPTLKNKILIKGIIELQTGMHIGSSKDFASIGAVDTVVVRDPITKQPIIPGSSLKGKLRTLLARLKSSDLLWLNKIDADDEEIKRLFGSTNPVRPARLIFQDLFLQSESVEQLKNVATDLYLTEIKFENTIHRLTSVANPRQIERVPKGAKFDLCLVYNLERVEKEEESKKEYEKDFENLKQAFDLLKYDYLGGHGSRGYGKVDIKDFKLSLPLQEANDEKFKTELEKLEKILKG